MASRGSSARSMAEQQPSADSRKSLVNETLSSRTSSVQSHKISLRTESNSFREPDYAAPHANNTTHLSSDEGVVGFVRRTFLGASTVAPPMGASDIAERLAQQFGNPEVNSKPDDTKNNRASHVPRPSGFKPQPKESSDHVLKTENGVMDAPINGAAPQSTSNQPGSLPVGELGTSPGSFKKESETIRESSPSLVKVAAATSTASASMQQSPKDNESTPLIEDQAIKNQQTQNSENEPTPSAVAEDEIVDEVVNNEKQQQGFSALDDEGKTRENVSQDATLTAIKEDSFKDAATTVAIKEGSFNDAANAKSAPLRSMTMGAAIHADQTSDTGTKPLFQKSTSDNGFHNSNWTPALAVVATEDDNNSGIKTSPETEDSKSVAIHSPPEGTVLEDTKAEDSIEQSFGAMVPPDVADVVLESIEEPVINFELSLRANNQDMESTDDATADCEKIKQLWTERMANSWTPVKEEHNKKCSEFDSPLAYYLDLHSFIEQKEYSVPLLGVLISYYGEDHPRVQEFLEATRKEESKEKSLENGMAPENASESESLFEKKASSSTETHSTFDTAKINSPPKSIQPSSPKESPRIIQEKENHRSTKALGSKTPHLSDAPIGLVVSRKNGGERQYHAHYRRRRPSLWMCCRAPRAD